MLLFTLAVFITKRRLGRRPVGAKTKRTMLIAFIPILWISIVLLFILKPEFADQFGKIPIENNGIKMVAAMAMIGALFLIIAGIIAMGESFRMGIPIDEKTKLITTGILKYIRNPGFLTLDIAVIGTFLIIPNMLTLFLMVLVIGAYHLQVLEEEKHLLRLHGVDYEAYKKRTGRYFPKLFQ